MIEIYLKDDITIVRIPDKDKWGNPLPTVDVAAKGKIDYGTKLIRDTNGREVVSSARITLSPDTTITHADKIHFDGINHVILAIEKKKDFKTRAQIVSVA